MALYHLIARQERLEELILESSACLPSLFVTMSRGHCRHLAELIVGRTGRARPNMPLSYVVPLAASISLGELNGLHRLHVDGDWEGEGIFVLLQALRQGACPQLRTLGSFFQENDHSEPAFIGEVPGVVEKKMQAIAETLEDRKKLGTCEGLESLEDKWMDKGSAQARERLLRLLLPSVTWLPGYMYNTYDFLIGSALKEVGAPFLEILTVPASIAHMDLANSTQERTFIIQALRSMRSLEVL
jgi:hypothetical protein